MTNVWIAALRDSVGAGVSTGGTIDGNGVVKSRIVGGDTCCEVSAKPNIGAAVGFTAAGAVVVQWSDEVPHQPNGEQQLLTSEQTPFPRDPFPHVPLT
jgi:hypothetical protein